MNAPFVVGIDLGTTNSALAWVDAAVAEEQVRIQVQEIPQLVNVGEPGRRTLLPSFLYVPGDVDFPAGSTSLPWDPAPAFVIGELARKRGAENPAHAKFCHACGAPQATGPVPCKRCGKPNDAKARFCVHCGAADPASAVTPTEQRATARRSPRLAAGALLVVAGVAGGAWWAGSRSGESGTPAATAPVQAPAVNATNGDDVVTRGVEAGRIGEEKLRAAGDRLATERLQQRRAVEPAFARLAERGERKPAGGQPRKALAQLLG